MTTLPDELRYSSDHLWARSLSDSDRVRVGLTDFAQESLGDIIAITPPNLAERVQAGQACGEVESTKSANDVMAPVSGTVVTVNTALAEQPELINSDPYGDGWIYDVELPAGQADIALNELMSSDRYRTLIGGTP